MLPSSLFIASTTYKGESNRAREWLANNLQSHHLCARIDRSTTLHSYKDFLQGHRHPSLYRWSLPSPGWFLRSTAHRLKPHLSIYQPAKPATLSTSIITFRASLAPCSHYMNHALKRNRVNDFNLPHYFDLGPGWDCCSKLGPRHARSSHSSACNHHGRKWSRTALRPCPVDRVRCPVGFYMEKQAEELASCSSRDCETACYLTCMFTTASSVRWRNTNRRSVANFHLLTYGLRFPESPFPIGVIVEPNHRQPSPFRNLGW